MKNQYSVVFKFNDWQLLVDDFGSLFLVGEWHSDTPTVNVCRKKPMYFSYNEPELIDESLLQYMQDNIDSIYAVIQAREQELQLYLTHDTIKTNIEYKRQNTKSDGTFEDTTYQVILFERHMELLKQATNIKASIDRLNSQVKLSESEYTGA